MDDGGARDGGRATVPRMVQQGDGTTTDRPETWVRRRRDDLAREARVAGGPGAALAALAAVGTAWWSGPSWATPALVLVAAAGALLTVVDARTHRLPDILVLPTWVAAVVLLGVGALGIGDGPALVRALLGGALGFGAYATLRVTYPPGLGFGDVKLAGMLGTPLAWLGWGELVAGLVLPFLLGGVWALGLLALRRAQRDTTVPFGPFMVLGFTLAVSSSTLTV